MEPVSAIIGAGSAAFVSWACKSPDAAFSKAASILGTSKQTLLRKAMDATNTYVDPDGDPIKSVTQFVDAHYANGRGRAGVFGAMDTAGSMLFDLIETRFESLVRDCRSSGHIEGRTRKRHDKDYGVIETVSTCERCGVDFDI